MMTAMMEFMLNAYKLLLSPLFPHCCRFVPTCSEYAAEAVARHGLLRGGMMALGRLLRCQPLADSGYDPVHREPRATSAGSETVKLIA